ncbi:MAG: hypothetical protein APR54_06255 [Candidatus Cloacimonas sp. SDB]|nr:MAG: hypothetical protein APR54_06255 [Candidatus Cloacimonas sp. SDB]
MKKLFLFIIVLALTANIFANGLSLNSIGTKALGMGGAFIGLADDPSAIYWNPAGLSGQDNGFNLSLADIIPTTTYKYADLGIDAEANLIHILAPNFFLNYNLEKLSLGLGVYVPAGLRVEWDGKDLLAFGGPAEIPTQYGNVTNPFAGKKLEWMSKLGVVDISPALSYQISDKFSIGLAANIYYGMLELKRGVDMFTLFNPESFGVPTMGEDGMIDTQSEVDVTGIGFGGALGLMYKASDKFNLGLSFRTPNNIKFEGDGVFDIQNVNKFDVEVDLEYPVWIGGGIAYLPTERFTITADAQYSQWSSLDIVKVKLMLPDAMGGETEDEMVLNWEDAVQMRLGLEYMATECLALRGGFYTDPAPAPDETLTILFPSGNYSVITGGAGYFKEKFSVEFSLEYLIGSERDIDAEEHNMPGVHDIDIFAFSLGFGYKL